MAQLLSTLKILRRLAAVVTDLRLACLALALPLLGRRVQVHRSLLIAAHCLSIFLGLIMLQGTLNHLSALLSEALRRWRRCQQQVLILLTKPVAAAAHRQCKHVATSSAGRWYVSDLIRETNRCLTQQWCSITSLDAQPASRILNT